MNTSWKLITILVVIAFAITIIIFGPLLPIYAMNTLLPYIIPTMMQIPYNFYTWCAVVALNLTWLRKDVKKVIDAVKKEKYV